MRILIISINYWPEKTGIGAFATYRAEYLASAGHEVTVCTTFPYYPDWKVDRRYQGRLQSSKMRNGVRILRSYAYVPERVTSTKRVVHEASFVAGSFLRASLQKRPDLLLAISPPLGLALSAVLLSSAWRIPYVFDVMDLQPDAAADLGMLPSWALHLMYRVEKMAYKRATLVSTLTEGMRDKIVGKGIPHSKVALFEPRADESLLDISPDEGNVFRKRFGLTGKFIVSHSGNLGMKQGLEIILDVAAKSRHDDSLVFLLVGNGSAKDAIERRAAELGLNNVRFLPLLNVRDFRGMLAASDICLITQRASVSDIVFPSKVVTYLAAGRAVVASVNAGSEVARVICESRAGLVVEPENPEALRQAIAALRLAALDEYRFSARQYARFRWSCSRVLSFFERSLVTASATVPDSFAEQEIGQ